MRTRLPRMVAASVMTTLQVSQKSLEALSSCARWRSAAALATSAGGSGGTLALRGSCASSCPGRQAPTLVQICVGSSVSMYSRACSAAGRAQHLFRQHSTAESACRSSRRNIGLAEHCKTPQMRTKLVHIGCTGRLPVRGEVLAGLCAL